MKKNIAAFLTKIFVTVLTVAVFAVTAFAFNAFAVTANIVSYADPPDGRAGGSPAVTVSSVAAAPGGTASLDVSITGNPGIYSFTFGFEYDESRLELKDVTVDPELGGQSQYSKRVVWISGAEDSTYNGRILVLNFAVKKGAPAGSAPVAVTFSPGDICNYNEETVDFDTVPGEVAVTGSGTFISDPNAPSLSDASELCVRLAGGDRIQTAVAVSEKGWESSRSAIIANAFNYPDALAGASLSKLYDAPILLTDSRAADSKLIEELLRLGAENIIILGGNAAVSEEVESVISAATGASVSRISGSNRNGTAAAIAKELSGGRGTVYLVSNANFADALSVSPIAATDGAPVLYVNPDGSIPAETAEILSSRSFSKAFIIGGTAAIAAAAEDNLGAVGLETERIFGDDRYMTSLAVCERFGGRFISGKAALATGKNFPDALSGAAFAAKYDMPVILLGDSVSDRLKDYISSRKLTSLFAFGGTGALPEEVINPLIPCLRLDRTGTADSGGGQQSDLFGWLSSCSAAQ